MTAPNDTQTTTETTYHALLHSTTTIVNNNTLIVNVNMATYATTTLHLSAIHHANELERQAALMIFATTAHTHRPTNSTTVSNDNPTATATTYHTPLPSTPVIVNNNAPIIGANVILYITTTPDDNSTTTIVSDHNPGVASSLFKKLLDNQTSEMPHEKSTWLPSLITTTLN